MCLYYVDLEVYGPTMFAVCYMPKMDYFVGFFSEDTVLGFTGEQLDEYLQNPGVTYIGML